MIVGLIADEARKIVASGESVFAVTFDSDSRVRVVDPIRTSEALEAFIDFYDMVEDDPPNLMSFAQLEFVPNVFCYSDRIDILVKACDVC